MPNNCERYFIRFYEYFMQMIMLFTLYHVPNKVFDTLEKLTSLAACLAALAAITEIASGFRS